MIVVDAVDVGKTIAHLRKQSGLTQRELAGRLKVTDKAVSRWERGLGVPDQSLLAALASALRTDVEAILGGEYAHGESSWLGVLLLRYGAGLGPDVELFGKRAIHLQLGYLMLAGLRKVAIVGEGGHLGAARRALDELPDFAMDISLNDFSTKGAEPSGSETLLPATIGAHQHGIMLVDGLDFLYGKDLTRSFKRQMADCNSPVKLLAHDGAPTSIRFLPGGDNDAFGLALGASLEVARESRLERGVIAFPIDTPADALDAANLLAILERHSDEPVMDLLSIACSRGLR